MGEHRGEKSPLLIGYNSEADCVQLDNEDVFKWTIALMVLNPDSLYHGGYFKAKMSFPKNYPYSPPGKNPHQIFF